MGKCSEIKLEQNQKKTKRKPKKTGKKPQAKPKKAYEIQSGIHSSQGISPRVSLQLQSAISTSVSSLPNLAVLSPLADPY